MDTSASQQPLTKLLTITLRDGTVYRLTTFGQDITFQSNVYTSAAISSTGVTKSSDMAVGTKAVTFPQDDSIATKLEILNGFFTDSQLVEVVVNRDDHLKYRQTFRGQAADVGENVSVFEVPFKNEMNTFLRQIPPEIYSEVCRYVMYTKGCKLNESDYLIATTVSNTFTNTSTKFSVAGISAYDSEYFDLGQVEFTSGQNQGQIRWIKSGTNPDSIEIFDELPYVPALSDTIELLPHCRNVYSTCDAYGNSDNYGGFEDIPDPTEVF